MGPVPAPFALPSSRRSLHSHPPLPPFIPPMWMKEGVTNLGTNVYPQSQWYLDVSVPEWRTDLVECADHDQQLLAAWSTTNPPTLQSRLSSLIALSQGGWAGQQ
jgi:hypothetical protein